MEGTQSQLGTRLTDGLCSNHTDCLTTLYHAVRSQVAAIALGTHATLCLISEDGTDLYRLDGRVVDVLGNLIGDFLTTPDNDIARGGVNHIVNRYTANDAIAQRSNHAVALTHGAADNATQRAAVLLVDDHIVCDVNKTTGKVTGVGGLQGGIGKTLAGTVGRDKVLEHRQTFLEVGKNGVLDGLATVFNTRFLRLSHQTTQT